MRRALTLCALTAAGLLAAGAYAGWCYGYERGRDDENAVWRNMMTAFGCAGYDFRTGEWGIIEGGTCSPFYFDAREPEETAE